MTDARRDSLDRRRQILDAAAALSIDAGLGSLTMRSAAERAGVSLRLVQYYFGSKAELLTATLNEFADRSLARWRARMSDTDSRSARELIESFVDEALPTEPRSREFHRFGVSFAELALSDPPTALAAYREHLRGVHDVLLDLFVDAGHDPDDADDRAHSLMAMMHGLSTMVLVDRIDATGARALLYREIHRA